MPNDCPSEPYGALRAPWKESLLARELRQTNLAAQFRACVGKRGNEVLISLDHKVSYFPDSARKDS